MEFKPILFILTITLVSGCDSPELLTGECKTIEGIPSEIEKLNEVNNLISSLRDVKLNKAVLNTDSGPILAIRHEDLVIEWGKLGIPDNLAIIEFYGENVDYSRFDSNLVEAVFLGYGNGHWLLVEVNIDVNIESIFQKRFRNKSSSARLKKLSKNIYSVCQVH